jgi:hypothetical protein
LASSTSERDIPGLARQAGGDDDDLGPLEDLRVVAAGEDGIGVEVLGGLVGVQGDTCRIVGTDIVQGDLAAQLLLGQNLGRGLSNASGSNDGDLLHGFAPR